MPTIAIGIPSARDITLSALKAISELEVPPGFTKVPYYHEGALLYAVRGGIMADALKNLDVDYLLMVDSDMVPPPDSLVRLHRRDVDMVMGLCPRRTPPYRLVLASILDEKGRLAQNEAYIPRSGLHEIEGGGLAFCLVKRHVLEAVAKEHRHPFFHEVNADGDPVGEDFSFCLRVRRLGFKVHLDADCHVGHLTNWPVTPTDYFREWHGPSTDWVIEKDRLQKEIRSLREETSELKERLKGVYSVA